MTDTALLRAKLGASGYKLRYIAERIGLTYQGFLKKINNKSEFKASEVAALIELLHIDQSEVQKIFFKKAVD